jgi:hypothetical protein
MEELHDRERGKQLEKEKEIRWNTKERKGEESVC